VLTKRSSSKVELRETLGIRVCGWQPEEAVTVTLVYPDTSSESQAVFAELDEDFEDDFRVDFEHTPDLSDLTGQYTFTFAGESGQVSHIVDVILPTGPRLYEEDDGQLLLYNFAPGERVRLFAYTSEKLDEERGQVVLRDWKEVVVNAAGQLRVHHDLTGIDYWVALGDVSGEVKGPRSIPGAYSILK
jgi:hypothetical protein